VEKRPPRPRSRAISADPRHPDDRTLRNALEIGGGAEIDVAQEMMRTTFGIILNIVVPGRASVDTELMKRSVAHYLEPTSRIVALAMMELRVGRRTPASIEQDTRRWRDSLLAGAKMSQRSSVTQSAHLPGPSRDGLQLWQNTRR